MRFCLTLCFLLSAVWVSAQSNPLAECIQNGDAEKMAVYFNSSIDINLPDKNGIYQKKQAKMLLKQFFENYPPIDFEVRHEGGAKQKSRYQIGKLDTEGKRFRTYLLYQSKGEIPQIIELRIEEE